MSDIILQTATRLIFTLLLLFSLFLLVRGHNEPGGGFIAGLVAAGGFALHAIAYDVAEARRAIRVEPRLLIGAGLLLAAASGTLSWWQGQPFLTGQWLWLVWPGPEPLAVGTPLIFDLGVYLVVIGVTLTIVFALAEE
jgi:multicomponent Na+:H+ antiporter subunit B